MRKDLEEELRTLEAMIGLYCRGVHGGREPCASCAGLLAYARARLERCPHRPKPACRDCATHCYAPEERARIRAVMRYAGPRLPLFRPLAALRHFFRKRRA